MPEPTTACRICGTRILQATASRTDDLCMPCARKEGTSHRLYDHDPVTREPFVCCECGGENEGEISEALPALRGDDPWAYVDRIVRCADCRAAQPLSLACREGNIS